MPANTARKYTQVVDRVEDIVGADLPRDLLAISIAATDIASVPVETPTQLDVALQGADDEGAVHTAQLERLDEAVAGSMSGVLTWGARSLQSVGADEHRMRLFDPSGIAVDPASSALEGALQASAADEFRVRLLGPDAGGALQQVVAEQFDTALATTDVGLATYGDRALASLAQDEVRVTSPNPLDVSAATVTVTDDGAFTVAGTVSVQEAAALDVSAATVPTEQQTPVGIEDSGGVQIDPATTALENALQANAADEFRARIHDSTGAQLDPLNQDALQTVGADELRTRLFGPDAGGVLQQVIAEQLDTAVAATDVGLLTWVARALNSVGQDELVARVTDATGTQVDPEAADAASADATALAANGEVTFTLAARGGDDIYGRVVSSGGYDVEARYQDDTGTTIFTETVASGVAGGTTTALGPNDTVVDPASDTVVIAVVDTSGADQTVDAVLHYN